MVKNVLWLNPTLGCWNVAVLSKKAGDGPRQYVVVGAQGYKKGGKFVGHRVLQAIVGKLQESQARQNILVGMIPSSPLAAVFIAILIMVLASRAKAVSHTFIAHKRYDGANITNQQHK
jgi:hypothetical protein